MRHSHDHDRTAAEAYALDPALAADAVDESVGTGTIEVAAKR